MLAGYSQDKLLLSFTFIQLSFLYSFLYFSLLHYSPYTIRLQFSPLQPVLELSNMTNTDIQEMEQVREHLQLMLQNFKGFNDHQGDYELAPSTTTAGD